MKFRNKVISIILAISIIVALVPTADVSAQVISGSGWSFDPASGTLTVSTNEGTTA